MKSKNRIFLNVNNVLREFLWFEQGNDGSLYLGNSASKEFSRGQKGITHVSKDDLNGTSFNITEGVIQSDAEIKGKTSYHQSGIINLSTISIDKRDRLISIPLNDIKGELPLVGIMPMNPTKYPESNKTVRDKDIEINAGINEGRCIGILIYIDFGEGRSKFIDQLKSDGMFVKIQSTTIYDRKLSILIYYDSRFLGWPKDQVEVIAHPVNGEVPWPLVVPSNEHNA